MADLSAADVLALKDGSEGFLEGNGIIILILFFLIFGMGGGNWGGMNNSAVQGAITRADLFEGFNNQDVGRQLQGISNGLCDGFYAMNTTLLQGFNGVNTQVAENRFAAQQCCCETNRNIDAVRYENAKNTCDIITANDKNTDRILSYLTNDKITSLQNELQSAQLQLSNISQTNTIINAVRPYPVMSVPFAAYGCNGCCNV